jgi:hypothetical protein
MGTIRLKLITVASGAGYCYPMLGSFEDAEDTVQETFLRAWRRRETFEGRSTFRAWLYRIATNACLNLLDECRPEPATGGELWLQPYPDRLLDELPAGEGDEPETVAVARETIELAYLVALQHLAPLHRGQRCHGPRQARSHAAGRRPVLDASHAGPARRPRRSTACASPAGPIDEIVTFHDDQFGRSACRRTGPRSPA